MMLAIMEGRNVTKAKQKAFKYCGLVTWTP